MTRDYLNLPDSDFDHFFNALHQHVAQKRGGAAGAARPLGGGAFGA
jgi:hypothetical protein